MGLGMCCCDRVPPDKCQIPVFYPAPVVRTWSTISSIFGLATPYVGNWVMFVSILPEDFLDVPIGGEFFRRREGCLELSTTTSFTSAVFPFLGRSSGAYLLVLDSESVEAGRRLVKFKRPPFAVENGLIGPGADIELTFIDTEPLISENAIGKPVGPTGDFSPGPVYLLIESRFETGGLTMTHRLPEPEIVRLLAELDSPDPPVSTKGEFNSVNRIPQCDDPPCHLIPELVITQAYGMILPYFAGDTVEVIGSAAGVPSSPAACDGFGDNLTMTRVVTSPIEAHILTFSPAAFGTYGSGFEFSQFINFFEGAGLGVRSERVQEFEGGGALTIQFSPGWFRTDRHLLTDPNFIFPDDFVTSFRPGPCDLSGSVLQFGGPVRVLGPGPDPNTAPRAFNVSYATNEDEILIVKPRDAIILNDIDGEGDLLTAVLQTDVSNGTLLLDPSGTFVYTPNPNFNGTDSFTYRANDGEFDSPFAAATVTINVASVNDPPVANPDSYTTGIGITLNVPAAGVLDNDSDVESDPLAAVLVGGVSNGALVLNANGAFDYTPNAIFAGTDTFTYKANDGTDDSNTTTVTITLS